MKLSKRDLILKLMSQNGEIKVSKSGNSYIEILFDDSIKTQQYKLQPWNVSPTSMNKIGKIWARNVKNGCIILLSKQGKIYFKLTEDSRFKKLNKNTFRQIISPDSKPFRLLIKLYYFNKRAEWISQPQYNMFFGFKLAESFKSFKEFKNYLGFDFISESQMLALFEKIQFNPYINAQFICDIVLHNLDRVVLANTKTSWTYIADIVKMSKQLDFPIEIYESDSKNKERHNDLVKTLNQKSLNDLSDEDVTLEGTFINEMNNNFQIEWLTSPRKLAIAGLRNKHCIGSYASSLDKFVFFSIVDDEGHIEFQINPTTKEIVQANGYKNQRKVPQEMKETINLILKNESLWITDTRVKVQQPTYENVWL